METYVDLMPYDGFDGKYLVLINHLTSKEISIVSCDNDDDLDYLGCPNLASLSLKCGFNFTDDEGEEHEITVLLRK